MVKLVHDIGVSDVAIAKACRKAGVPLPGRGHWAKSEKQRQRKPKPPKVEGKVGFQVLDRDTPPAKTGTDLNSSSHGCLLIPWWQREARPMKG